MTTIIHILGDANLSGTPIHVTQLVRGLNHKLFQHVVLCPEGPAVAALKDTGATVQLLDLSNKWQFRTIASVRKELIAQSTNNSTIIHCHGVRAGLFGRLAARNLNIPVIYTEHSWTNDYHLPNPVNAWIQKSMLSFLDRYTTKTIAVSKAVADFLVAENIVTQEKLQIIHNGIAIPSRSLPLQQNYQIGSIGSLTWQKNYTFLIKAIATIKQTIPTISLEIIGEGPEREQLETLIQSLDLQKNVMLIGSIPHDKLPEFYKKWSFYVQPSTNESFGIALAEVIAAGLPAIGSRVGSIPEVAGDNATFTLNSTDNAAKLIIDYLQNEKLRASLQDKQLAHMQQFSEAKMLNAHEKLYDELLTRSI
jgi:glycosyltransferase involved in cell wall biosynthesis